MYRRLRILSASYNDVALTPNPKEGHLRTFRQVKLYHGSVPSTQGIEPIAVSKEENLLPKHNLRNQL